MGLSAGQVALLRCEVNRIADLAAAARAKTAMTRVSASNPQVDQQLIDATAAAAGYALTLWEVGTVRFLGRYSMFDAVYDDVERYADAPSSGALAKYAPNISLLLAAIAQLRGIPDACGLVVNMPGLVPPAPEVAAATMERPPAPRAPDPVHRGQKLGVAFMGAMSAATLGLVGMAVWNAADEESDSLRPPAM